VPGGGELRLGRHTDVQGTDGGEENKQQNSVRKKEKKKRRIKERKQTEEVLNKKRNGQVNSRIYTSLEGLFRKTSGSLSHWSYLVEDNEAGREAAGSKPCEGKKGPRYRKGFGQQCLHRGVVRKPASRRPDNNWAKKGRNSHTLTILGIKKPA